jgi:hypothetical protein
MESMQGYIPAGMSLRQKSAALWGLNITHPTRQISLGIKTQSLYESKTCTGKGTKLYQHYRDLSLAYQVTMLVLQPTSCANANRLYTSHS